MHGSDIDMLRHQRRCATTHPSVRTLGTLIALLLTIAMSLTFGTEDVLDLLGRLDMLATLLVAVLAGSVILIVVRGFTPHRNSG